MILIDSSVLVSYAVEDDANHNNALEVIKKIETGKYGEPLTSDHIFDETLTVTLIRSKSLQKAVDTGQYLHEATEILKINDTEFDDAWKVFKEQKASKLSFTDCTILSMMKERNISYVATFDKEFSKIKSINVIQ